MRPCTAASMMSGKARPRAGRNAFHGDVPDAGEVFAVLRIIKFAVGGNQTISYGRKNVRSKRLHVAFTWWALLPLFQCSCHLTAITRKGSSLLSRMAFFFALRSSIGSTAVASNRRASAWNARTSAASLWGTVRSSSSSPALQKGTSTATASARLCDQEEQGLASVIL
jgi:hypothetical protein